MKYYLLFLTIIYLASCQNTSSNPQGEWIKGSEEDKLAIIEHQFAGFSTTMREVGYRYQELYWAGKDENWQYAHYMLEHIDEAIEAGLQRRPERTKSSEHFVNVIIEDMYKAIESKDTAIFRKSFEIMRIGCNSCHAMEEVPFIYITVPDSRLTSVRYPN